MQKLRRLRGTTFPSTHEFSRSSWIPVSTTISSFQIDMGIWLREYSFFGIPVPIIFTDVFFPTWQLHTWTASKVAGSIRHVEWSFSLFLHLIWSHRCYLSVSHGDCWRVWEDGHGVWSHWKGTTPRIWPLFITNHRICKQIQDMITILSSCCTVSGWKHIHFANQFLRKNKQTKDFSPTGIKSISEQEKTHMQSEREISSIYFVNFAPYIIAVNLLSGWCGGETMGRHKRIGLGIESEQMYHRITSIHTFDQNTWYRNTKPFHLTSELQQINWIHSSHEKDVEQTDSNTDHVNVNGLSVSLC